MECVYRRNGSERDILPHFVFPEFGQRGSALAKYPGSSPAGCARIQHLQLEPVEMQRIAIQISPRWIVPLDERDFSIPPQALQKVFASLSGIDIIVRFEIHEAADPIAFGEPVAHTFALLPGAAR